MSDYDELTNGLFTVVCECGKTFKAEDGKCECGSVVGELKFDIDAMLNRVYEFSEDDDRSCAIDVVYGTFWQLGNRFDIMNDILEKIDMSKLGVSTILSFLTNTFKYSKVIPNHYSTWIKAGQEFASRGKTPDEIKELLEGLTGDDGFWENMDALGAPSWLTGPRP